MDRLTQVAQVSLPYLKWVLLLGLLANFATMYLWWGEYEYYMGESRHGQLVYEVLVKSAVAGCMLLALPGNRIVNVFARATAALYLIAVLRLMYMQLVPPIDDPLDLTFAVPLAVLIVGAVVYVISARNSLPSWLSGGKQ